MKTMCNKFIAVVLTIAMLAGFAVTAGATTASELTVTSIAVDVPVPTGKIVTVDVEGVPSDASKVVIKNGDDEVASADAANGTASIDVTVVGGITKYVVEAQSADGDVVASGRITIKGAAVEVISTKYDNMDFGDEYGLSGSAPSYTLTKNGSSMGVYLHSGNATNEIKIEENPNNNEMGKSLHFIVNDPTANVQANEMGAVFSEGTVVYEVDFCAQNLNKDYTALTGAFYPVGASNYSWIPSIMTTTDGNFVIAGSDNVLGKCEANTWYRLSHYVDLATDYCYTYIDNKLVAASKLKFDAQRSHKLSVATESTNVECETPCGFYIDNVTAYNATIISPDPSVMIASNAENACIPEGTKARINVVAFNIPQGSVANLVNVDTGATVASVDYAEGLNFEYALPEGAFSYKVVIKDSLGEVVAQSNALNLIGYDEAVVSSIWNENFEGATTTNSGASVSFLRNGSALKASNNATLGGHIASADSGNTITIGTVSAVENGANGDSVILTSAANNCQLNSFGINCGNDVIDVSVDFATDTIASRQAFALAHSGWNIPGIYTNDNGVITFNNTVVGTYTTNKWYNLRMTIDTVKGVVNVYIDNVFVATAQKDTYKTSTSGNIVRLAISNQSMRGVTYIDNFKVQTATYTLPVATVAVEYNDYDHALAAGTKIAVKAKAVYTDDVASFRLVQVYEGASIAEVTSSTDANFELTLKPWAMQYKVQALDASGDVVVESAPFAAYGKNATVTKEIWNEDFEGVTINNNSLPAVAFERGGSAIKGSNGSGLQGHTGKADNGNSITVGAASGVSGKNNGDSIAVNSVTAECQLNNWGINSGADIVDVSVDFAVDSYGARQAFALVHGSWVFKPMSTNANGEFVYKDNVIGKYTTNKWYNLRWIVDSANGILDIYIDDVHVVREQSDSYKKSSAGSIVRLAISNKSAVGTIYVDNYKVFERSVSNFEYKLAEAKLVIDGSFAENVTNGNLTVSTVVTGDTSAAVAEIIVAVYGGNELVSIKTAPVAFTEGGAVAIGNKIEVGAVSAGQKVKVMLWEDPAALKPVCKTIDFE